MSPQRSNRQQLVDGALRCLERLPPERVTARAIADEAGANLASITYHFGSKDNLVTEAAVQGLDRWLADIAQGLEELPQQSPAARFRHVAAVVETSRRRHLGLVRNYFGAVAKAQHNTEIKDRLAAGFRDARPRVAALLGLGADDTGVDAAGLALAMFHGLLLQVLLDPALGIDGDRLGHAQTRLLRTIASTESADDR